MVSVSPPSSAAKHSPSRGRCANSRTITSAQGTDSADSTEVPTYVRRCSARASPCRSRLVSRARRVRAATEAFSVQWPASGWAATKSSAASNAPTASTPSIAALTAAARSPAASKPCRVSWVTRQEARTARASASSSALREKAMPTGATRIAAPLVVPSLPVQCGSAPARTRSRASLVEGPSRSRDPRARISSSQRRRASASWWGSMRPPPSMRRPARMRACSVSSVTVPAGAEGAMGCSATASRSPVISP